MADSNSDEDCYRVPMKVLTEIQQLKVSIRDITSRDFGRALKCYSDTVFNQVLDLDRQRFESIPDRLKRPTSSIPPGLQSDELSVLSHWTYKRCQKSRRDFCKSDFRNIKSSNLLSEHVQKVTSTAFKQYNNDGCLLDAIDRLKKELPTACFETATLILSVAYPDKLPSFSPDLIFYCENDPEEDQRVSEDDTDETKYQAIVSLVEKTGTRMNLKKETMAHDVEKVAYVLKLLDSFRDTYADPMAVGQTTRLDGAANARSSVETAMLRDTYKPHATLPSDRSFVVKSVSALSSKDYRIIDYLQEIKISQELSCKEIFVKLYAWSFRDGHLIILMELMRSDLDRYLGDHGTWKTVAQCSIKEAFGQLLSGIKAMHLKGMTHRDIKPQASA